MNHDSRVSRLKKTYALGKAGLVLAASASLCATILWIFGFRLEQIRGFVDGSKDESSASSEVLEAHFFEFRWQSRSFLGKSDPWVGRAKGTLLIASATNNDPTDPRHSPMAVVTTWEGNIDQQSRLFQFQGHKQNPLGAALDWGYVVGPAESPLEPAGLPITLQPFSKLAQSGSALGANLLASILHRALWLNATLKDPHTQKTPATSELTSQNAGLKRTARCSVKSFEKNVCNIEGWSSQAQSASSANAEPLFRSVESLSMKEISPPESWNKEKFTQWYLQQLKEHETGTLSAVKPQKPLAKTVSLSHEAGSTPNTPSQALSQQEEQQLIQQALKDLDIEGLQESAKTSVYLKLKSLLAQIKSLDPELKQALQDAAAGSTQLQLLAGAFAASGNAQAQQALVDLIRSEGDSVKGRQLLAQLGFVQKPSLEMVKSSLGVIGELPPGDLRAQGLVSLGTLGNAEQGLDPESRNQIRKKLEAALDSATDRLPALAALGNMGDKDSLTLVKSFATDPDPNTRGQALMSLRKAAWGEVASVFATALQDGDERVVLSGLRSLQSRSPADTSVALTVRRALLKWPAQTRSESLWELALRVMHQHGSQLTEVRASLAQWKQTLRSESLRQTAASLLGS